MCFGLSFAVSQSVSHLARLLLAFCVYDVWRRREDRRPFFMDREKRKEERSERDREEREVVKDWYIVLATGVSHSVAHHA